MKIRVTMKDPDCLHNAVQEAVREEVQELRLPPDELEGVVELRIEKAMKAMAKWFRWGEYLSVEIDTEAGTAVVLPEKP